MITLDEAAGTPIRLPAAWPALMPLEMASRYLSLDENSFRLVTARAQVGTIDLGLNLERWRKRDLDRLLNNAPIKITERPSKEPPPQPVLTQELLVQLIQKVQRMSPRVEPDAIGIQDAVRMTGLGRTTIYKLIGKGRISPVRVGGRTLIKRTDIQRLLQAAPLSE